MENTLEIMIGQTGEGQHEYAMQYLRQELASCIRQARSGNIGENFSLDVNEYTRILVNRCPEHLQAAADRLQHTVVNRQIQILVGKMYFAHKGKPYSRRPKTVRVNEIAPKISLTNCMIG